MENENKVISIDSEIEAAEKKLAELRAKKQTELEEARQAEKRAKKQDAMVVETAINKYEEAKALANDKIEAAYVAYRKTVEEAERNLADFEKDADTKLNAWLKAHPGESFHYSYKSPDGKVSREYSYYNNRYKPFDFFKEFKELFDFAF